MIQIRPALWAVLLLLADCAALLTGCSLLGPEPVLPTPVRPPEIESVADALNAAVAGDFPIGALAIGYTIGSEAGQGITVLAVHGSGAVYVTFDWQDEHQAWQSTLSEDAFLDLCRLLVDHEIWAIRGQRQTGVPEEPYPLITVEAEGFEPLHIGMWFGEAVAHPGFGPIMDALSRLAYDASGGGAK